MVLVIKNGGWFCYWLSVVGTAMGSAVVVLCGLMVDVVHDWVVVLGFMFCLIFIFYWDDDDLSESGCCAVLCCVE